MNPSVLDLWSSALDQPVGLKVKTDDPTALQQELYKTRRLSGDARLMGFYLSIRGEEVWIVRGANLPEIKSNGGHRPLEMED
ncbi:MAG TPA: hypothetical protein VGA05_08525 [Candidatus Bathyarchaeia archaeon]